MTARLVKGGADAKGGGDGGDSEGTNQHQPGTEAASAKGEYAGMDSGLEADGGISMAAPRKGRGGEQGGTCEFGFLAL